MLYICVQKGDGNLKKKIQTALRPGRAAFYVLFLLFAACGLYFSKPYGFIGMAIVIICGLSYATLMTLYIVPILYDILFKKPPLNVDIGSDKDLDDIPDDAAEFIAAQSSAAQPQPEA